jgi:hypothetical protein
VQSLRSEMQYNIEAERSQPCTMSIRDLVILLRALYLTFTKRRVTVRRALFTLFAVCLYLCFRIVVRVGHMVDDLFFRGYQQQAVHSPLYIIALPRSGTTFLHRLLCLDDEQFTYVNVYQTLLPAVSLDRLISLFSGVDRRPRGFLPKFVGWLNRHAFVGWRNIHPIDLARAEEDEGIFLYPLWTLVICLFFPFVDEYRYLQFTDQFPKGVRDRVMRFYRRCLQRHLYASGNGRTLVTKNVHSTGRIASILETFPAAKFVFVMRNPYETIPSLLSFYYAVWEVHSPDIPRDSPETHALAQVGYDYYRYLKEMCQRMPDEQYICVGFEELIQDPEQVVERIYDHFSLPMSEAFRVRLRRAIRKAEDHEGMHCYSLEEYGLSEQEVYDALQDVFEFARGYSTSARKWAAAEDAALLSV